jgi:NitT/TauT family transport system permease protein
MDKSLLASDQPLVAPVFVSGQTGSQDVKQRVYPLVLKTFDVTAKITQRSLAIVLFLLMWELVPRLGLFDRMFLPPFSEVLSAFVDMIISGELFLHIGASLKRSFTGLALGFLVAVPLGILIGWFDRAERFLDPLLQLFRNTSTFALFPVFIIFFGIGEVSKIAIIFWGTSWPLLINSISGVKHVDPLMIKSARSMGTSNFWLFLKVILPAATPSILTGFRLSATHSILILVASEMMGASQGLGFLIHYKEQMFEIGAMYAGVITLSLIGLTLNFLIVTFEKRVLCWKQTITE